MTTMQLDISTPRIGHGRIDISRKTISMIAATPSKQTLRDEIARQTAQFCARATISVIQQAMPSPYLETPRRPDPDRIERKVDKPKPALKLRTPPGMLCQDDVMARFGYADNGDGRKRFKWALEEGLVPPPDYAEFRRDGRGYRSWWPATVDDFIAARAQQLHNLAEKHCGQ